VNEIFFLRPNLFFPDFGFDGSAPSLIRAFKT